MTLVADARLGPYEILGLIGAGGMGEVYKARDPRLGRTVAIKVLPAAVAGDRVRLSLFEREARAIAALSHPNVLVVHDVGTDKGSPYLVTELLEGQNLRERLAAGPLPATKALDFAVQIASGLAAAHEKGIVHHDIKPENVFVTTGGALKILDFGVAQLKQPGRAGQMAAASTCTDDSAGLLQGTIGYMAPEQVRGLPSDHRADVFAFGCVLYEMLSGKRAFAGNSPADTLAAILTQDPPPLDMSGGAIPPAVQELVRRCLEKEPGERFSSAHDLALALRALSGSGRSRGDVPARGAWIRRHKILVAGTTIAAAAAAVFVISTIGSDAVLSFAPRDWILVTDVDNQTGERVLDTALATAFVVSLEQSTYANVFPRSRIAAALKRMGKADAVPISEAVGREICVREKVRGLISPAISKVGQSYSLTARIIDPATGDTVRSYIQDAPNQDRILPALGALAANIRRDLGESLAAIDQSNKALPQVTTSSLEALSMYANGAGLWSKAKYDQAVQLYLSALELDPDFAMAHAAVGVAYHSFVYNRPAEAKVHLERAMQLSARTTRREAQIIEIEYEAALGHFDKVRGLYETFLKTYPDDFRMRYSFGTQLRDHGKYGEAIPQYLEVLRISPNDANAYINLATCYSALERTSDALKAYAHAFELEPEWMTSGNLNHEYGFAWVRAGDLTKAEEVFNKGLAAGNTPLSTRSMALLHMYRGQYGKAIERLREAVLLNQSAKVPLSESRNQLFLATALEARGDRKGSAAAVERAAACLRAEVGQIWMASRIGTAFARQGAVERARAVLRKCEVEAQAGNTQQSSDLNRLRGELAWATGAREQAREFLRVADTENHTPLSQESLARAARLGGRTEDAIVAYETLLAMHDRSLGWEPQQLWLEGHYWLADLYRRRGDTTKAQALLDSFLLRWKDADPDVTMLKRASDLRAQLTASARPAPTASSRLPVATGR